MVQVAEAELEVELEVEAEASAGLRAIVAARVAPATSTTAGRRRMAI
jgi:hypothetical protein